MIESVFVTNCQFVDFVRFPHQNENCFRRKLFKLLNQGLDVFQLLAKWPHSLALTEFW